jgi:hypothetical protein
VKREVETSESRGGESLPLSLAFGCALAVTLYSPTATLTRARSTIAQQESVNILFTSTEDALILQLLKEGHSPLVIERRWSELSRRIAGSATGATGRATRRKEKGAVEERASR